MPLSDTHELSESQTRALLINPQLVAAEWKLSEKLIAPAEAKAKEMQE